MTRLLLRAMLSVVAGLMVVVSPWLQTAGNASNVTAQTAVDKCDSDSLRRAISRANADDKHAFIAQFNGHCPFKIVDDDGPRPQDRVLFNGNSFQVQAGASGTSVSVPTNQLGAFFNGVREQPILTTPATLHGSGFNTALTFAAPGILPPSFLSSATASTISPMILAPVGSMTVSFNYFSADATSNGAVTGFNTGFAFLQPFGGLGGITALPGGQAARATTTFETGNASLMINVFVANQGALTASLSAGVTLDLSRFNTTESLVNIANPGIGADTRLTTNNVFVAPKLAAEVILAPPGSPIYLGINGFVAPGYLNIDGTAGQAFRCNVCAPMFDQVLLGTSDSKDMFALQAGFGGRAGILINPTTRVELFANYVYNSALGVWQPPAVNTDPPNALFHKSSDFWATGVNLDFQFRY